jgi:hypothetical protein
MIILMMRYSARTGALMDEVGDFGDNKDSEALFFDDEGI